MADWIPAKGETVIVRESSEQVIVTSAAWADFDGRQRVRVYAAYIDSEGVGRGVVYPAHVDALQPIEAQLALW